MNKIDVVTSELSQEIRSLWRCHHDGKISNEEFCSNALVRLIHAAECVGDDVWLGAVLSLESDTIEALANHCDEELGRDFDPPAEFFLVPGVNEEELAAKKTELRASYELLAQCIANVRKQK